MNRPRALYQLCCVWLCVTLSCKEFSEGLVFVGVNSTCFVYNVSNQSELDIWLDDMTLERTQNRGPRCIQLSLTANEYQLNVTNFARGVDLMENDSLLVRGKGSISCNSAANLFGEDSVADYLSSTKLSKASLVVFDGLVFTGCVLPVNVEEVDTVVIQNCVFR